MWDSGRDRDSVALAAGTNGLSTPVIQLPGVSVTGLPGLGNLGYDVSTTNALKPLADTMAHTLAVAVFFCEDRGRAVHPKLHTGLLQVLPDHPTQPRNEAL
ncbi:hypothetical protein GEV33_006351 [Tenebrio molitor]|uniref:Uncharacterized protein n=1 Tax=Tenebrio molitor TaxID=7067 RepID=A0A8J6LD98_TENMO|nr:hypothetical protein GEV33_006351 [Tenebrio molitor]